ncbi:MAG: ROK family protein [Deltaproteobacteria bacterium]|nr:ROK family protein [Deltaproteobacteria bacterium]
MYILGLDIGGTKTEAALSKTCPGDGKKTTARRGTPPLTLTLPDVASTKLSIFARKRIPTTRRAGFATIVTQLTELCSELLAHEKIGAKDLSAIGIGLPGSVDPVSGKMLFGNTIALAGKDLARELASGLKLARSARTACKIVCENDANCFALAEALCGAGAEFAEKSKKPIAETMGVGVILGTGVGGGIVIGGRILRGRQGGAGEIGHTELYTNGHACYCGRNGCAEGYLSGAGFEAHFASRIYSQIEKRPDAKGIFDLCRDGDPIASAVVQQYRRELAKFLGHLTNILDPDYFVLGGGMSNAPQIYEGLRARIQRHCFLPDTAPAVYRHALGDSSGVIGAALLAFQKVAAN